MSVKYIISTVDEFFYKLDKLHQELENFSQNVGSKRDTVFVKLSEFKRDSEVIGERYCPKVTENLNVVEQMLRDTIGEIQNNIHQWYNQIEKNKKGTEFMRTHEKYLVVMVFGAVKAGKSSLGNFFAGKYFSRAAFDNRYKTIPHPQFACQEKGRELGDVEADASGMIWFSEGVTDTTGAIQYYTLSGMRWMDSPGTGALGREGDTRNMEEMVNEYIPYTDMCIFLMNSSEPGLQADMKYMERLSREGQEALVVITKSDVNEEDEDAEGNIIDNWQAKPQNQRKLQEDDICKRLKETYPSISSEKYRAMSVSTMLGKLAIEKQDEQLYKDSNLDSLMKVLGDKVSDDAIALKERKPKQNLNNFIDSIIEGEVKLFKGINGMEEDLNKILEQISNYKSSIDSNARRISRKICLSAKVDVQKRIREMANSVDKTGQVITGDEISKEISKIIQPLVSKQLNDSMRDIIDNFNEQQIHTMNVNVDTCEIKKEHETVKHEYEKTIVSSRDAEGFWQHVGSFFGKTYYTTYTVNKVMEVDVDLGTNVESMMETLIPKVEDGLVKHIADELKYLQDHYFIPQEEYISKMTEKLKVLKQELTNMKYSE